MFLLLILSHALGSYEWMAWCAYCSNSEVCKCSSYVLKFQRERKCVWVSKAHTHINRIDKLCSCWRNKISPHSNLVYAVHAPLHTFIHIISIAIRAMSVELSWVENPQISMQMPNFPFCTTFSRKVKEKNIYLSGKKVNAKKGGKHENARKNTKFTFTV